ncbi:hypothetical protein LEM8419_01420 [Neolewinella maritima]|uniref:Single-stranded DNA-binding protein n=1 Tax=Neolewinella maritima TaxID=1383882 RepID=A0ABN8F6K9_9BACT|nr:single-stranded DNA-binding protein [Neolewinella maritima]CAH1000270.1 hypothetical protein LEM8419_01420 [Neolewinella maritima]
MNKLTLIGELVAAPTYFCTSRGRDLTRFQLRTKESCGRISVHHCLAWGPLAINLHANLRVGEWSMVRGSLAYRTRRLGRQTVQLPYVRITEHSYLGQVEQAEPTTARPGGAHAS